MKVSTVMKQLSIILFSMPCLFALLAALDMSCEAYSIMITTAAYVALILGGRALSALYDFGKPFRLSNAVLTIFLIVGLPTVTLLFGGVLRGFFLHVGPIAD
jgi:hypothetical protein